LDPRVKPEDDGVWVCYGGKREHNYYDPASKDHPSSLALDDRHPHHHPTRMGSYTYIITNHKRGTLYIGVTANIERRIYEHREGLTPGFAWKYGCTRLVWYEDHADIVSAIQREKSLKRWYRQWKIELIEKANPDWRDLYYELW
jgi:putative endonuclease